MKKKLAIVFLIMAIAVAMALLLKRTAVTPGINIENTTAKKQLVFIAVGDIIAKENISRFGNGTDGIFQTNGAKEAKTLLFINSTSNKKMD